MHWWLLEISVGEKILRWLIVYFFLLIMFRLLGKTPGGTDDAVWFGRPVDLEQRAAKCDDRARQFCHRGA